MNQPSSMAIQNEPIKEISSFDANSEALKILASGALFGTGLSSIPNSFGQLQNVMMTNGHFGSMNSQGFANFHMPCSDIITKISSSLPPTFYMGPRYTPYSINLDSGRRKNATREVTAPLKQWLNQHKKNPYPTKGEKVMLAMITNMTMIQVSTWFANARRRLKKENKITWSPRTKSSDDEDEDMSSVVSDNVNKNHEESTSTPSLTSENVKVQEGQDSVDDTKKAFNGSASSSKIWSIADTLNVHKDENPVEKNSYASGSPLASTSTTPIVNQNLISSSHFIDGIHVPQVLPRENLSGLSTTPFSFLTPIQQKIMAALVPNAQFPLVSNPFFSQSVPTTTVSMAPNMFLNPLLMQTFGMDVPSVAAISDAHFSPTLLRNDIKKEEISKW